MGIIWLGAFVMCFYQSVLFCLLVRRSHQVRWFLIPLMVTAMTSRLAWYNFTNVSR